jgi:hypothetical protein
MIGITYHQVRASSLLVLLGVRVTAIESLTHFDFDFDLAITYENVGAAIPLFHFNAVIGYVC